MHLHHRNLRFELFVLRSQEATEDAAHGSRSMPKLLLARKALKFFWHSAKLPARAANQSTYALESPITKNFKITQSEIAALNIASAMSAKHTHRYQQSVENKNALEPCGGIKSNSNQKLSSPRSEVYIGACRTSIWDKQKNRRDISPQKSTVSPSICSEYFRISNPILEYYVTNT